MFSTFVPLGLSLSVYVSLHRDQLMFCGISGHLFLDPGRCGDLCAFAVHWRIEDSKRFRWISEQYGIAFGSFACRNLSSQLPNSNSMTAESSMSIIFRLGWLHFVAIFILDYLCICVKECCVCCLSLNLSSSTQCHSALSKFIIMIKNSWQGALRSVRNMAVPCENFLLNQFLCVFM